MKSLITAIQQGRHDPFKIVGPTCIQVSGGRTSGYMLWRALQSNGSLDREDVAICFENTGKEDEATLRFVRDMGKHWSVPITWLEYTDDHHGHKWVERDFDSASRNGEPFEMIIKKRNYLPNPVTRFCTVELKIRTVHRFLQHHGWHYLEDGWEQWVGIRADEQRRVSKIRGRTGPETAGEHLELPLADAGVTLADVDAFWKSQPFRLELSTDARGRTTGGNCDLCFLKPAAQILSLVSEKPQRAVWWASMEALALRSRPSGWVFRTDRPTYAAMHRQALTQSDAFGYDPDEEAIPCFCGD